MRLYKQSHNFQEPLSSVYSPPCWRHFSHNIDLIRIIYISAQVIIVVILVIVVIIIVIVVIIVYVVWNVGHGVEDRHYEAEQDQGRAISLEVQPEWKPVD